MVWLRRVAGMVALTTYLVMGAMLYFTVLPGAGGLWPPDFHLRGYDVASITPFVMMLSDEARQTYGAVLMTWDRVFIASLAAWVIAMGWRGGWMRWAVAFLAVVYAAVDLSENAAIYRFVSQSLLDARLVDAAHHLTMAKFSALYLCLLVLIVHLRRTA
ncbi:hypothetical protein [Pseudooctadecabacter jejudonensis]|uniref:DUF4149 domain-containing protein n=1 Tax=Pseudooctadecabacter jejudonensis TaxID=1391910 RepID=A0A1Y5SPN1_9RHOB|nr:hypothetical protein [Pseudooctadecabacter jejudonensis]SLN44922.1 hypothetical protein PSJ8397_02340 [Pseudooctadecabacter jejudonensis]